MRQSCKYIMMGIKQNEWFGVLRVKLFVFVVEKV